MIDPSDAQHGALILFLFVAQSSVEQSSIKSVHCELSIAAEGGR
jgi:hypothetical protein